MDFDWICWICYSRIKHIIYIFGLAFLRFLVQIWYIACIFGIGPCSMNCFRKKKKPLLRVMTLDKKKLLISRVVTLDTSIQHSLSRVMTVDKDKILSSTLVEAVKTSFSTVFLSTPFDSHLNRRNNLFRRFLILISRVLTLAKSPFFCSGSRTQFPAMNHRECINKK